MDIAPADESASEIEERLIDVVASLVAYLKKTPEAVYPRQRPLHYPPVPTRLLAGLDAPASDTRSYTSILERLAASRKVVALVGVQLLWALTRGRLRGRPRRFRIGEMASTASSRTLESWTLAAEWITTSGTPAGRPQHGASSPICPSVGFAPVFWPPGAGTLAESKEALSQSISSASPRIDCAYPIMALGLERALESQARVQVAREAPEGVPSSVILCTDEVANLAERIKRVKELDPDASILIFGLHVDLQLARTALRIGARGVIHAGMTASQVVRAVTVAASGEIVTPRELLHYLVAHEDPVDFKFLSARQRELLQLVTEGLSNAQIARRLYLSESTVKQHLRAAYKLPGVSKRTEAAALMRGV